MLNLLSIYKTKGQILGNIERDIHRESTKQTHPLLKNLPKVVGLKHSKRIVLNCVVNSHLRYGAQPGNISHTIGM